jgi:hypothetical protein
MVDLHNVQGMSNQKISGRNLRFRKCGTSQRILLAMF